MKIRKLTAIAVFMATTAFAGAASAYPGYTVQKVNLRAGPGTNYPVVVAVGPSQPVEINGCLDQYNWCDVQFGPFHGWMYGRYIQAEYQSQEGYITEIGQEVDVPIVTFDIGDYWDYYYTDSTFYRDRVRYHYPRYRTYNNNRENRYYQNNRVWERHDDRRDDRRGHDRGNYQIRDYDRNSGNRWDNRQDNQRDNRWDNRNQNRDRGNDRSRDNDRSRNDNARTEPLVTQPVITQPIITQPLQRDDRGHDRNRGNDRGRDYGRGRDNNPRTEPLVTQPVVTQPVVAQPVATPTPPREDRGHDRNRGNDRPNNAQPTTQVTAPSAAPQQEHHERPERDHSNDRRGNMTIGDVTGRSDNHQNNNNNDDNRRKRDRD